MIVFDASILIAFLDASDNHHARAVDVLVDSETEQWGISPITLGEVLVGPTQAGRLTHAENVIADLELVVTHLPESAPSQLAGLRVSTGLRMPDCCVLLAALSEQAAIATFDNRLATAASSLGYPVIS